MIHPDIVAHRCVVSDGEHYPIGSRGNKSVRNVHARINAAVTEVPEICDNLPITVVTALPAEGDRLTWGYDMVFSYVHNRRSIDPDFDLIHSEIAWAVRVVLHPKGNSVMAGFLVHMGHGFSNPVRAVTEVPDIALDRAVRVPRSGAIKG